MIKNQLHNSGSHRNAITLFKANYKSDLHILTVKQKSINTYLVSTLKISKYLKQIGFISSSAELKTASAHRLNKLYLLNVL